MLLVLQVAWANLPSVLDSGERRNDGWQRMAQRSNGEIYFLQSLRIK